MIESEIVFGRRKLTETVVAVPITVQFVKERKQRQFVFIVVCVCDTPTQA